MTILSRLRSLILSFDVTTSVLIYFISKLFAASSDESSALFGVSPEIRKYNYPSHFKLLSTISTPPFARRNATNVPDDTHESSVRGNEEQIENATSSQENGFK
jgi:hypothetical protein